MTPPVRHVVPPGDGSVGPVVSGLSAIGRLLRNVNEGSPPLRPRRQAAMNVVILAEAPEALIRLCGTSLLERLLRTLQRAGFRSAVVLSSTPDAIAAELAKPSWARRELTLQIQGRPTGPLTSSELHEVLAGPKAFPLTLVLPAGAVYDERLLRAMGAAPRPMALVDSHPPPDLDGLLTGAPVTTRGLLCGPVVLDGLATRLDDGQAPATVCSSIDAGLLPVLDVAEQPVHITGMRRDLRPIWFPAPASTPEAQEQATRVVLDAAQKAGLDLPARVHAPLETFIIRRLCWSPITPNQLSALTTGVALGVTVLFAIGHLGWGIGLALLVGVLDGLDGKQARVKVETSELGELEHLGDYLFESSWWGALAFHLGRAGEVSGAGWWFLLLMLSDLGNKVVREVIKRTIGRDLAVVSRVDRAIRLVGGGPRNVNVWILAVGLLAGNVGRAFVVMCLWGFATAVVHLFRAGWILQRRLRRAAT